MLVNFFFVILIVTYRTKFSGEINVFNQALKYFN